MSNTKYNTSENIRNKMIWRKAEELKKDNELSESLQDIYFKIKYKAV